MLLANIVKRTKRGNMSFIIILMILIPVILLPMVKLIGNSYEVQNNLLNISKESNVTNSVFEIALFESLNYIDGMTLSDFNSTELKNKINSVLTTNLKDLDVTILVDDNLGNGKIQLNLGIDDKTTLILKIDNIQLEIVESFDGGEVEGITEGEEYIEEPEYLIDISNYVESRWVK